MRIQEIAVTNLFGLFNHCISLNLDERITIIHGINGVGKTSILKLINGFFNREYLELLEIPFEEITIKICRSKQFIMSLKINKKITEYPVLGDIPGLKIIMSEVNYKAISDGEIIKGENFLLDSSLKYVDGETNETHLITFEKFRELEAYQNSFSLSKNLKKAKLVYSQLPLSFSELETRKSKFNTTLFQKELSVNFIECQRLVNVDGSNTLNSIAEKAKELAEKIQFHFSEYGELSQSLDRTFPIRVVEKKLSHDLTEKKIRQKLIDLDIIRQQLINVGLLEKKEDFNFPMIDHIDETTYKLLVVYIEDTEKKLNIFSNLAKKLELFQRIINQRFSYKILSIDKNHGFIFKTNRNEIIMPTDLSSGEQNELIMLYELLFNAKPGSLILIDEPEISLHVGWQVKFLEDLQEIAKLADIDILLATHSPDIINGRWDLTVELKGLVNERVH